jgi:hypothetical protein
MVWATAADVTTYTGVGLPASPSPDAVMALANTTVSGYANRTEAASASISGRDLLTLKVAAAFQAAWLVGQPDFLTRLNFRSSTVDGESVAFASESQQNLAPMASRYLRNLSWKASRTLSIPDISVPLGGGMPAADFLHEGTDEFSQWES